VLAVHALASGAMQLSGAQRGAGLLLCTGGCVALLAARATKQGPPRRRFSGARVASMSQTLSASPLAAVTTASSVRRRAHLC
jgi:hypothetical protein